MKKFLAILGIIISTIILVIIFAYYFLVIRPVNKGGRVEVNIDRNYTNNNEERLIELAESIDCDASNIPEDSQVNWLGDITGACVVTEDIAKWQSEEKKLLESDNTSSNYIINYKVYTQKNKGWPGSDSTTSITWDKNNNVVEPSNCLDMAGNDYWTVVQKKYTSFGRADQLAGSGADDIRYLLFDSSFNFVCQQPSSMHWIN